MATFTRKPRGIQLGKIYQEDFANPVRIVDFLNHTPWYVYVLFGSFDQGLIDADPDWVLKPYSSQILQPPEPTDRLMYQAREDWPVDPALGNTQSLFGLVASDKTLPGDSSYKGVGITGRVINVTRSSGEPFIAARNEGDKHNRLELYADGTYSIGPGAVPPEPYFQTEGPGSIRFARPPYIEAIAVSRSKDVDVPEFSANQLVTREYVDSRAVTDQPDNYRGAAAVPSSYPLGMTIFRRTDGAGGWPQSSIGLIITFSTTGGAYTYQLFVDRDSNNVYERGGVPGDSWSSWASAVTYAALGAERISTPGLAAGFGAINPLRIRKTRTGIVKISGRIQNNSANTKASGSRLCNIPAAFLPPPSDGNPFFICALFAPGAASASNNAVVPIWIDIGSGELRLGIGLGSGADVDLGAVIYWSNIG